VARIRDAKGRDTSTGPSGYERLFGVPALGALLSKCHATVISSGNELERVLEGKITAPNGIAIGDLNKGRRVFKGAKKDSNGVLHDIGVDVVVENGGSIKLIELKDGDVFDVKKVAGEVESLLIVKEILVRQGRYSRENISVHFCSFNQDNKENIYKGAKGLLPEGSAMTGRELCQILGLDYDSIVSERKGDEADNRDYFVKELVRIEVIKKALESILRVKV
jgi:hypothetical protein